MSLKSLHYRDRNPVIRGLYHHNRANGQQFSTLHFVACSEMARRTVQRILWKIQEDPLDKGIERDATLPCQWTVTCGFSLLPPTTPSTPSLLPDPPLQCHPLYPTSSPWWLILLLTRLGLCALQSTGVRGAAGGWYPENSEGQKLTSGGFIGFHWWTVDWRPKRPFMTAVRS